MSPSNGTTPGASSADAAIDLLYAWMPPPTPPPAPCPEAVFSLTLKGTLDGQEALLTARGQTAAAFKANLEAIRGLLDVPAAHKPTPQTASQPQGEGWCTKHAVQMTQTTKDGRSWWSHRTPEGQWCKGK